MRRLLFPVLLLLAASGGARAQSEGLLQVESDLHQFLERQQANGVLPEAGLGAKPLSAYEAHALLDSLALRQDRLSRLDRRLLAEYRGEAVGGLLRGLAGSAPWLYRNGTTALSVEGDDFGLEAEPLAVLAYGPVNNSEGRQRGPDTSSTSGWQNTRGFRAGGHLDLGSGFGRVFFETRLEENQVRLPRPAFGEETAPRLGFVARPEEGVYDYFVATGSVGYHTRRFEARFGRDRNRWGYGRESVTLSNYATVYDQLQLRWNVWRIDFQNLYARFTQPARAAGDPLLPSYYGAFHRLSFDFGAGVEAELFESVIFAQDSTGRGGFELAYLNPFQFFRGTERELGSPDNAFVGAGLAWTTPARGARLYGQFLLDELKVSRFFDSWWGNKWAYLVGAYFVDPAPFGLDPIRGFDLRVEYARIRPYTYSHRAACNPNRDPACPSYDEQSGAAPYLHYGDFLGHPAGANASDVAVTARWRPDPDFITTIDVVYTRLGRNSDLVNYGSDPSVPYETRPPEAEDEAETLWGIRQNRLLIEGRFEARLLPQLFAGAAVRVERVDDAVDGVDRYVWPQVMLRWGLPFPSLRY